MMLRLFDCNIGLLFLLNKGDTSLYQRCLYVSGFYYCKVVTSNKVTEIFVSFKSNNKGALENFFELRFYL